MNAETAREFFYFRGRGALYALLKAAALRPGDEVLLQAFTCLAVPAPVLALGLKPVYVDAAADGYGMCPDSLAHRLSERSRVLVIQHTFGIPARVAELLTVAREHGLLVLEDNCHVLGGTYRGTALGDFGAASFHSFEWGKPLVAGVGGSARVRDAGLAAALAAGQTSLHSPPAATAARMELQYFAHLLLRRPGIYWGLRGAYRLLSASGVAIGTFRPEEFLGLESPDYRRHILPSVRRRIESLRRSGAAAEVERRRRLAGEYAALFARHAIPCPWAPEGGDPVFLRYPFRVADKPAALREAQGLGIEVADWFATPVHPVEGESLRRVGYEPGSCPRAEALSASVLSFPMHGRVQSRHVAQTGTLLLALKAKGLL